MRKVIFITMLGFALLAFTFGTFIGCNNTKTGNTYDSPYVAPATDTVTTTLDSNAYILK